MADFLARLTAVWNVVSPTIDVLLISFLLYQGYRLLVNTRAVHLIRGALIVLFVYVVATLLDLRTLRWILNLATPSIVVSLVIIFQPELRTFFTTIGIGTMRPLRQRERWRHAEKIMGAADILSYDKRGALMVFTREGGLRNINNTGTILNADLSTSLLLTIFSHDTPLHDGAVVIEEDKIVAAGCLLPLSERVDVRSAPDALHSIGTRHRAALGIVEDSDAVVLVISEENGAVSLAYEGELYYDLGMETMIERLTELLGSAEADEAKEEGDGETGLTETTK